MTIEPVTELGSGGALRLPRARVVPMSAPPASYTAAVERYLTGAGIAKSSARIYRISLTTWGWMLAGEPPPTGPARRGAKPPVFPVAAIDDPALPEVLAELAAARADEMDADTVNRELSIARKAIGWWQRASYPAARCLRWSLARLHIHYPEPDDQAPPKGLLSAPSGRAGTPTAEQQQGGPSQPPGTDRSPPEPSHWPQRPNPGAPEATSRRCPWSPPRAPERSRLHGEPPGVARGQHRDTGDGSLLPPGGVRSAVCEPSAGQRT